MTGFLAILFRQKYIDRWGLMRNTEKESLAEHASEVAAIAHVLCTIGNTYYGKSYNTDRAVSLALFHDVPEVFTGDLPTPVKYFSAESKKSYSDIENIYVNRLLSTLPAEMKETYSPLFGHGEDDAELRRMVKIADKLAAYIKCVKECASGNRDFFAAKESTEKALEKMKCPELDYFTENFLPAFGMSLDELQEL